MRLIDDKVYGFKVGFLLCGGAVGVARLISNGHHGGDGVSFFTLGDVHTDALDRETQTGLRLVVHRGNGERELTKVAAHVIGRVVDGFRFRLGFRAGCKHHGKAA